MTGDRALEDTITTRALAAIPGIVLALTLTACGSSGDGGGSANDGSGSSESSTPEATGNDYAALFETLFEQQGKVDQPKDAAEFNEQADFPEGVSVAKFDQQAQSLCIQDEGKEISGTFNLTGDVGIVLRDGVCGKGDQVSKLVPDPEDQQKVLVQGDKKIGQPVVEVFEKQQAGGS